MRDSRAEIVFLDGRIMPGDDALRQRLAPGVLTGTGVFETMRVRRGGIFLLREHLARLFAGLAALRIKPIWSKAELTGFLTATIKHSRGQDQRVRLTVWQDGQGPHVSVIVAPYIPYPPGKYKKGFKAMMARQRRRGRSPFTRIKSIDYGLFLRAYQAAQRQGYDEAVILNETGDLVEGSRTNIFFVRQGTLCTPALKCGCIKGIIRDFVLKMAKAEKVPCRTVTAKPIELLRAEEAFVTNSLMGIMPLTSLAGEKIGGGKAGPLSLRLMRQYQELSHNQDSV